MHSTNTPTVAPKRPPLGALCVWRVFLMAGKPARPVAPRVVATSKAAARRTAENAMAQAGIPIDRVFATRLLGLAETWSPSQEARR